MATTTDPGVNSGPQPPVGLRDERPLMVAVHVQAHPDQIDRAKAALMEIADPIRANPDCLDYRVYQDRRDPSAFLFYERWVSEAAFEEHLGRDYMGAYTAIVDELFSSRRWHYLDEVHRLDVVGAT
jgi:quinol monooxygenase YgiN